MSDYIVITEGTMGAQGATGATGEQAYNDYTRIPMVADIITKGPIIDIRSFYLSPQISPIGDSRPISTQFTTLAAAQVFYPHATSLSDEIDWCAAQGALNYASNNGGGIVYAPKGIYILSNGLEIPSNINFFGDGIGVTVFKLKNNLSTGSVSTENVMSTEDNGSNIIIENLTADGNKTNQSWAIVGSANYGISVRSDNTVVRNVECKNVTGNGCGVPTHADNVIFDGVHSHDNGKKGLHSGIVTNIKIINGFYYNNQIDSGIGIHSGMQRGIITNNHCFNNVFGINIGEADLGITTFDFVCANNICYDNSDSNIFINGMGSDVATLTKNSTVTGNYLKNGRLMCTAANGVLIADNMLINSWMYLITCFNTDVKNNMILNPPESALAGIKIHGTNNTATILTIGDNVNVLNNTIDIGNVGVPYAIQVSNSTNTNILDNIMRGTPASHMVRVHNNMQSCKVKQVGSHYVRIEEVDYANGFDNYSLTTTNITSKRPVKAVIGQTCFDTTLNIPMWCKTSSITDGAGTVITPAVWSESYIKAAALADIAIPNASNQTTAYVQADVQSITNLVNALKTDVASLKARLRTAGLMS